MSDSDNISEWECIENIVQDSTGPTQYAQDVDACYRELQEAQDRYNSDQEAGYNPESASDIPNSDSEVESNVEGGGCSLESSVIVQREGNRRGKRNLMQPGILGDRIVANMVRSIRGSHQKLVRESIRFGVSENDMYQINNISQSLQRRRAPFVIGFHSKPYAHWHVVHYCPWKWYCCRCYAPPGGKRSIKTNECINVTEDDLQRIIEYLCTDNKSIYYLFDGLTYTRNLRGIEFIFNKRVGSMREFEGSLEACENSGEGTSVRSNSSTATENSGRNCGSNKCVAKSVRYPQPEEVEEFIMNHPTVPIESICLTNPWLGSKFRYLSTKDDAVRKASKFVKSHLTHWKIEDFIKYYESDRVIRPLWACIKGDVNQYYLDRVESKEIILKLIQFQQCDIFAAENLNDVEGQTEFWTDIYNICNRTLGKKNTFELIGPANCGKSFFCNWLSQFFINVGHVENFNRYHAFPLQSAYNARILNWGEAMAETSSLDTVKLLLGGDPCPANIKYESTQTIEKTPVLITANKRMLPDSKPFQERMIRYIWQPCVFLKDVDKKPHPLSFIDILRDYNIIRS